MKEYRDINGKQVEIETRIFPNEVGSKENAWNGCNLNLVKKNTKKKKSTQMNHNELERYMQLKKLGIDK